MNINEEKKLNNDFNSFYNKKRPQLLNYFKKRVGDNSEDLVQDTFIKFLKEIKKGKYPLGKWKNLLSKIAKGIYVDSYRRPKEKVCSLDKEIITKNDDKTRMTDLLGEEDKNLKEITTDNKKTPEKKIWQLRGVLLSGYRSLQEVMLIYLTPSSELLVNKIRDKFPSVKKRYDEKGVSFEIFYKNEKMSKERLEKIQNEICNFSYFLFKAAEKLKVNDWIGVSALKILLLSPNPWKDLYFLNQTKKVKTYLSFDKEGKIYDKKITKRPYLHFFRDFIILSYGGIKKIKRLLKEEAKEKINYPSVNEKYIKDWYKIGALNSEILKKQKWGRKNKKGLKKKIEEYDLIIQKLIKEI